MTKHFKLSEFLRTDQTTLQELNKTCFKGDPAARKNLISLVTLLEVIRRLHGKPIVITSGYRCSPLNTAVGGVNNSLHLSGRACDLRYDSSLLEKLVTFKNMGLISELIPNRAKNYIHVGIPAITEL